MVNNGNFLLLLTSSGHDYQFHIATDILVVMIRHFILLMTSSGKYWQYVIAMKSSG